MNTINYTIPVNLVIAEKIGSDPALVLQQIKYWTEKCGRTLQGEEGAWIYNSYEEWHKQFSYWSLSKLRRIIKFLEDKELIFSKKANAKKWNHTKWYSINFERFNQLFDVIKTSVKKICSKVTNRSVQNEQIIDIQKNNYTNRTPNPLNKGKRDIVKSVTAEKKKLEKGRKGGGDPNAPKNLNLFVDVWNSKLKPALPITLTARRKKTFIQILATYFQNDLSNWESFLDRILSSDFLMGKVTSFRATFDWVLRKSNLLKILEGNYHPKNELEVKTTPRKNTKLLSDLKNNSTLDPRWKATLQDAIKRFGEDTYVSWFSKMELDSEKDGVLKIRTPSNFIKEWIDTNYGRALHSIGEQYFDGLRRICFACASKVLSNKK